MIKFVSRGMGPYFVKEIVIEVADCYYKEYSNGDVEYYDNLNWGGFAFGDEKIFIFINPKLKYPFVLESNWTPKTKYIDGQSIKNKKELFVYLCAHELGHLLQYNLMNPVIASNIINLDEESQSDIIAMIVLNKWRRKQNKLKEARKAAK